VAAEPGESPNDDEPEGEESEGEESEGSEGGATDKAPGEPADPRPVPYFFSSGFSRGTSNLFPGLGKGFGATWPDLADVIRGIQTPLAAMTSKTAADIVRSTFAGLPDFSSYFRPVSQSSFAVQAVNDLVRSITKGLPDFSHITRGLWPANLSDRSGRPDVATMKKFMLDEGLPIAWVPRAETMRLLVEAGTPAERRAIYGRRWRGVVTDCEQLVDAMTSVATSGYVRFLRAIIDSLRAGHSEAAQALAATTLDTAVSEFLAPTTRKTWIGAQTRIDPDDLSVRQFFVFSQLWGIHRHFFVSKGDPIPGTFNRHGSVHAVTPRQYSRLNAVLGLAHLTSFLYSMDLAYAERGKR
jgi:hypothetical protein